MEEHLSQQKPEKTSVFVIRHAQSDFNVIHAEVKTEDETRALFGNPELMDPSITQLGVEQCHRAAEVIKDYDIGLVLVSPFRRALQTATEIFRNHPSNPKYKALPVIGERMGSVGDISTVYLWEKDFAHVDFSALDAIPHRPLWHIHNMEDSFKAKLLESLLAEEQVKEGVYDLILDQIKASFPETMETDSFLKDRVLRARKQVKEEAEKLEKGKKLAIVTHSGFISYFTAESFTEAGTAVGGTYPDNCQVIEYVFE